MKNWSILILLLLASFYSSAQASMTVECDGAGNTAQLQQWLDSNGGATDPDGCSAILWTNDYSSTSNDCGETGHTTVIFTATDDCGLEISNSAVFTIEDTTTPTVTVAIDETVECDGAGNIAELLAWLDNNGGATATDDCSNVSWTNDFTAISDDCGETGTTSVTFTATDDCGLSTYTYASFTIVDTTPPTITEEANDHIADGQGADTQAQLDVWLANNGGATASDYCSDIEWTHDFNPLSDEWIQTGSAIVTFTATDECGSFVTTSALFSGKENLVIDTIINDDDCEPGNEEITISASEGTAPYIVTWTTINTDGSTESGILNILTEGGSVSYEGMIANQEYQFVITDSNGNEAEFSHTSGVTEPYVLSTPSLCLVTTEFETGNNNILWENPENMDNIFQFNIYREGNATGVYDFLGSIPTDQENRFVDKTSDPKIQAYKYQLRAADECGLESEPSNIHKTIHLVVNQGVNSLINLEWDNYDGISYDQVTIYRGTSPQNMEELITLPSTVNSFTDTEAPAGMVVYQIVIPLILECEIGKMDFSVRSNLATIEDPTSTVDLSSSVKIYPNPMDSQLMVQTEEKVYATLLDLNGRVLKEKYLKSGNSIINTEKLETGSYIFKLTTRSDNYSQKIIKI